VSTSDKGRAYGQILDRLEALLEGLEDPIAVMASAAAVLHEELAYSSWTGFYRVVAPELLRIGPYQGPVGCLEIPFGQGVCGVAAQLLETQVVPDVHAFPGHIACDPDSRSEIVVPVPGRSGSLYAVLDLDSRQPAAFDDDDRVGLEAAARLLQPYLAAPDTRP
jgi:GAF domain-containing protein